MKHFAQLLSDITRIVDAMQVNCKTWYSMRLFVFKIYMRFVVSSPYTPCEIKHFIARKKQKSNNICDRLYEKRSYSLSKFSTSANQISAGFQGITFILHQTIVVCQRYIRAKFQSNAIFTSQIMGFQICANGINYKTPFCRASHISIISGQNLFQVWLVTLLNLIDYVQRIFIQCYSYDFILMVFMHA